MIISIFILSIVSIFLLIKLFQNYSISDHIYLYNSVNLDDKFFEQTFPRVTGIARSLSLLAILLLLSIFFFGGEILKGFSFAMILGVILGTYSSIFIANPILVYFRVSQKTLVKDED